MSFHFLSKAHTPLAGEPAAPIDKHSAIQRHVSGVSALSRRASAALSLSPLRQILNSSSFQPRSEEHTSELQSLPTRRSSDLAFRNPAPRQRRLRSQPSRQRRFVPIPFAPDSQFLLLPTQIGRAHV